MCVRGEHGIHTVLAGINNSYGVGGERREGREKAREREREREREEEVLVYRERRAKNPIIAT